MNEQREDVRAHEQGKRVAGQKRDSLASGIQSCGG